jgi:hypothetical protein
MDLSKNMKEYHWLQPYELVYGKRVLIWIEIEIQTLRKNFQLGMESTEAQK